MNENFLIICIGFFCFVQLLIGLCQNKIIQSIICLIGLTDTESQRPKFSFFSRNQSLIILFIFKFSYCFADKQFASALASLESARSEAERKQLYLERLVTPNLPDKALEPRRIRSVFMVLAVGLLAWGVVSLLVASIKEHAD